MAKGHGLLGTINYKEGSGGAIGEDTTVVFQDNSKEVLEAMEDATLWILTMWGIKLERWAKKLCPVGTVESTGKKGYRGGTLRNSITFEVDADEKTVSLGTNVEYGPYVELGTGPYFTQPPDWENFDSPRGSGKGKGYVRPRPFLRPAVEDHRDDLKHIAEKELENG